MTSSPVDVTAERRARLAADRRLSLQRRRLCGRRQRIARLDREIAAKRDELGRLRAEAGALRQDRTPPAPAGGTPEDADRIWSALQTIRDGFAIFDADHRLVVANQAYLSIFDGLEEMRPGIPFSRVAQLLYDEGVIDPSPHGAGWVEHVVSRWRNGPIAPELLTLWNGQMVSLIDRRLPCGGIVTLAVNQTDMRRTMAAIEAIPDGFVVFDHNDRLVMCNRAFREHFGDTGLCIRPGISFADMLREGLRAGRYTDALGREEAWLEERLDRRAAAAEHTFEQQLSDGRWVRLVELKTPDGGAASLRIDITELKRQQEELCRLHRASQAAARAKSAFLSNMSHEIRTPVHGIVGMAELLVETVGAGGEAPRFAATLRDSATALLTLVDDILDFSNSESGLTTLSPEPFDPARLAGDTLRSFAAAAHHKGLDLVLDLAPGLPPALSGDARRLRQILTNLLANALKFTPCGQVALSVGSAPDGPGHTRLKIAVADTGPGIPEEEALRIFAGFAQGEEDCTRSHDGAGLGLAICRRLAELMAGDIAHRPRPGGGSVFTLSLTLPRADRAPAAPAATSCPGLATPPGPRAAPAAPIRILAAEDNRTNRMILKKLLAPLGVSLEIACNGVEAVAAVAARPPDLVLMDISMPDMDGREAARRIRAAEAASGRAPLPIVAMTAHSMADDIADIHAAGIDHVLVKPLTRADLADRIAALRGPA